ncbi:hypothetical protein [Companilactobacillus paralimentarius]|nr:hypothetical protein [Companilactobacillus paralimentarius]
MLVMILLFIWPSNNGPSTFGMEILSNAKNSRPVEGRTSKGMDGVFLMF